MSDHTTWFMVCEINEFLLLPGSETDFHQVKLMYHLAKFGQTTVYENSCLGDKFVSTSPGGVLFFGQIFVDPNRIDLCHRPSISRLFFLYDRLERCQTILKRSGT